MKVIKSWNDDGSIEYEEITAEEAVRQYQALADKYGVEI